MSFSVDLWNGFDIIKNQIFSVQKKIKNISKVLSMYLAIESGYNKSLENIYKEFKETFNSEYLMDKSYMKILDIFEYENQNRKILSSFVTSLIMEPLNEYLRQPNLLLNKCLSENTSNEESFRKSLNILKEKQSNYWRDCKELAIVLAQNEMEEINNANAAKISKNKAARLNEKYNKLIQSKKEYIDIIVEANKEREKYNSKTEEILNNMEQIYKTMIEQLRDTLTNFALQRNEFLHKIYTTEKNDYDNLHSKVIPKAELFQFITNNATKEFPMMKFEFCPLKYSVLNQSVKSKYTKFPENSFPRIYKAIKNYFEENKIFKDEIPYIINRRNTDFLGIFSKKILKDGMRINKDKQNKHKEFIENYINELFMNDIPDNKQVEEKTENNNDKDKESQKDIQNIDENNNSQIQNNQNENNQNITVDSNNQIIQSVKETIKGPLNNEVDSNKPETEETSITNNTTQNINLNKKVSIEIKQESTPKKELEIEKSKSKEEKLEEEEEEEEPQSIQNYFYIEHPNYLENAEILIKKLSYIRSKGQFVLQEGPFDKLLSIFFIILNQENKNYYILKNLLILSQTFYKIVDNKKIYLQQGMKGMKIFSNPEIWHRVINYSMNLSCSSMDFSQTKEETIEKINKEAEIIVVAYLCDIKQFINDENVFNEVKNFYVKVYDMDEENVNKEVEKYLNSLKQNESSAQEKHVKIEEKSNNEDDADNESSENNLNNIDNENIVKQRSNSSPIGSNTNNNNSKDIKEIKEIDIKNISYKIKEDNEGKKDIELINNTIENNDNNKNNENNKTDENKENNKINESKENNENNKTSEKIENNKINENKENNKSNENKENNKTNENNENNTINENKKNNENNKTNENNENKNQIINNNINIIKIEAKEVIILGNNSNSNIDIEKIKSIQKDSDHKVENNSNKKEDTNNKTMSIKERIKEINERIKENNNKMKDNYKQKKEKKEEIKANDLKNKEEKK